MSLPQIVNRDEWLAARKALLEQEKELTRRRDALSADRRRLPMVEITEDYRFTGPQGEVGLIDLFEGRKQLIVGHFMFDPDWEDGCPSCSAGVDEMSPRPARAPAHPRHHARLRVARAAGEDRALEGQEGLGRSPGTRPAAATSTTTSASRSTSRAAPGTYNYRPIPDEPGVGGAAVRDARARAASSASTTACSTPTPTFARGAEQTGGSYYFLDLTALGRQEEWEEPKGRSESARAAQPDFAS